MHNYITNLSYILLILPSISLYTAEVEKAEW